METSFRFIRILWSRVKRKPLWLVVAILLSIYKVPGVVDDGVVWIDWINAVSPMITAELIQSVSFVGCIVVVLVAFLIPSLVDWRDQRKQGKQRGETIGRREVFDVDDFSELSEENYVPSSIGSNFPMYLRVRNNTAETLKSCSARITGLNMVSDAGELTANMALSNDLKWNSSNSKFVDIAPHDGEILRVAELHIWTFDDREHEAIQLLTTQDMNEQRLSPRVWKLSIRFACHNRGTVPHVFSFLLSRFRHKSENGTQLRLVLSKWNEGSLDEIRFWNKWESSD